MLRFESKNYGADFLLIEISKGSGFDKRKVLRTLITRRRTRSKVGIKTQRLTRVRTGLAHQPAHP